MDIIVENFEGEENHETHSKSSLMNMNIHSNKIESTDLKLLTAKEVTKNKSLSKSFSQEKCDLDTPVSNSMSLFDRIMNASQRIVNKINIFSSNDQQNESDKNIQLEENKFDELDYDENKPHKHDHQENNLDGFLDELELYVEHNHNMLKTECYFWTKLGKVKGVLTLKQDMIIFDPLRCEENCKLSNLGNHHWLINLKDIINAQVVKLPNETAQYIKDEKDRQWYIYDYYLQLTTKSQTRDSLNRLLKRDKKKAMIIKYTKTKKYGGRIYSTNFK